MPQYLKADELKISLRGLQACQVQAAAVQNESGSVASVVQQQVKEIAGCKKHDSSPCASQSTATSLHTETFANTLLGFTTDKKIRQKKKKNKKKKKLCAATTQHTTLVIWSTAALYLV
jgi:hypothetical protein